MGGAADTIFAVSSGPGRGAIAVIRLSGAKAGEALARLSARPLPAPRLASLRRLSDPSSGEALDEALVLFLPGPGSFTGEDMAELHVHGGRAVVSGVLEALAALPGLRPAEAGEFARRAFDHGKLDLAEAEGLADLIAAETAAQRRQALRQASGALGAIYDGWRRSIIEAMALAEAEIDFSDQELPDGLGVAWRAQIDALARSMASHLDDGRRGELTRDGLEIAILGPPNAGKSSLINILAKRDVAIVSATAGTTRDVVEVRLDLGGYPVTIADTAGLREAGDDIEAEGVRRALRRAEDADLKIVVLDGATWPRVPDTIAKLIDGDCIVVLNKIDLLKDICKSPVVAGQEAVAASCQSGAGIAVLLDRLLMVAKARLEAGAAPVITRLRHRLAVTEALSALGRALEAREAELAAEDLRLSARALARIAGRIDVEDVLDQIFNSFCIGK